MTIAKDKVIHGLDFVGDMALAIGKLSGPYAKQALSVGLVLKGASRALKIDDEEDLDSLLAKIRVPRRLVAKWVDIEQSSSNTDMATPGAKALGRALEEEE